ncbi:hypothetical protein MLD38_011478 [Melastoma candidum]|uniref:Uncharacterized protein n=1 Tax=Melastoma candidum TaxID=119954 RepID=A0ACB9R379_9MYRT|nr:hypothetical protein MLD38_011478 [Melastoma candidum]
MGSEVTSGGTFVLSAVVLFVILPPTVCVLVKALYELWWNPIRIQRTMSVQGIRGPPYRFVHGSTLEASRMISKVALKPMQGLSHEIFPKVQPHFHAWIKAYGRNYLTWYGSQARLLVSEVELVKEILNNKDKVYPKVKPSGLEKKLLGVGVAFSEGEKWERQRKLAHHAFHGENLKAMIPAMVDSVRGMLTKWEKQQRLGKEIEVFQEFKAMLSEVISRTAFGTSYIEGSDILQMMADLAAITSKNYLNIGIPGISYLWKTADDKEADRLEKGIRAGILNITNKREKKQIAGEVDGFGNDFLGQLLKAYHETEKNEKITVNEMVDECKTFYFAGHEASNASLVWTLFLLAVHPDWQEKARMEVLHVSGDEDPTFDGISKLRLMTMILNESLRLYTPGVGFIRKVARQTRLGKLVLPAGDVSTKVFQELKPMKSGVISRAASGSSYVDGTAIFQMPKIWRSANEIEGKKLGKRMQNVILDLVKKRETAVVARESADYGHDSLGYLLTACKDGDDDNMITIDILIEEGKTSYSARQETVA